MPNLSTDLVKVADAKAMLVERDKIISDMNSVLRAKYAEMSMRFDEHEMTSLKFYYWLGAQVNEVLEDVGSEYGTGAMKKISRAWTIDPSMLYKAKAFNEAYSEEDLDRLCSLKTTAGTRIGWSHVIQLLGVSHSDRDKMQDLIVDEAMTAKELSKLVQKLYGKRRIGTGRNFQVPKTVRAGFAQLRTASSRWMHQNSSVWVSQEHSFFQKLENMPPNEMTHELVDELEQLIDNQSAMATASSVNADSASRLIDSVKAVLQERERELTQEIREGKLPPRTEPDVGSGRRAEGRGVTSGDAPHR
jgi:hypothetical protein